ncbi:MAG: dienelactone hydrolase family protein [Candidatus Zipacnadales bacterium]
MTFYDNILHASPGLIQRGVQDRQHLLRCETEDFLRALALDYEPRQRLHWRRDYSSIQAYEASVAPNRQAWQQAVGDFDLPLLPLGVCCEPFMDSETLHAEWITLPVFEGLTARAVLAVPKHTDPPWPVVICQHGISSSPERVFGFTDDSQIYHAYGQRLVEAGFAVLAPLHLTEGPPRARYHRLCLMLGKTLWGLEIRKLSRLLDYLETRDDLDTSRIGMYGISLGGAYTSFTMPLERRIRVGVNCAWFNDRLKKMVIDDPRYSCFLSVNEEHIFIPGWLTAFCDADLTSLICPRPYMVQTGKADGIAWWPFVVEEFERAKAHYEKLGLGDRCVLDLHEGGHEIHLDGALPFLRRWLIDEPSVG